MKLLMLALILGLCAGESAGAQTAAKSQSGTVYLIDGFRSSTIKAYASPRGVDFVETPTAGISVPFEAATIQNYRVPMQVGTETRWVRTMDVRFRALACSQYLAARSREKVANVGRAFGEACGRDAAP